MTHLPADPEGMNDERAVWGRITVEVFQDVTGSDDGDALGDLLSDLMHLCDRTDAYGTFDEMLRRARMHYRDETAA